MLSKCLYEILFLPKGFLALVKHPAASIIIYIPIDFEQPLNFSLTDIGFLRNLNFASPSRLLDAPDAFIKRQILQIFLARNSLLETFNFVDRESPDVVTIPRQTMAKLRIIRFYGLSLAHRGWLLGDVKQQLWYIPVAFTISDLHHIPIRNPFAPANSQIQSQRIWRHHVNLRLSLNDVGIFLILLLTIFQRYSMSFFLGISS